MLIAEIRWLRFCHRCAVGLLPESDNSRVCGSEPTLASAHKDRAGRSNEQDGDVEFRWGSLSHGGGQRFEPALRSAYQSYFPGFWLSRQSISLARSGLRVESGSATKATGYSRCLLYAKTKRRFHRCEPTEVSMRSVGSDARAEAPRDSMGGSSFWRAQRVSIPANIAAARTEPSIATASSRDNCSPESRTSSATQRRIDVDRARCAPLAE
jgi:hypothetical protein